MFCWSPSNQTAFPDNETLPQLHIDNKQIEWLYYDKLVILKNLHQLNFSMHFCTEKPCLLRMLECRNDYSRHSGLSGFIRNKIKTYWVAHNIYTSAACVALWRGFLFIFPIQSFFKSTVYQKEAKDSCHILVTVSEDLWIWDWRKGIRSSFYGWMDVDEWAYSSCLNKPELLLLCFL